MGHQSLGRVRSPALEDRRSALAPLQISSSGHGILPLRRCNSPLSDPLGLDPLSIACAKVDQLASHYLDLPSLPRPL